MKLEDALAQLARETARARTRLALERGLRAGLPVLAAAGAWACLALAGAHALLPPLGQSMSALVALVLLAWLSAGAARNWRAPSEDEARARLALDSRLDPGAFETLRDQPSHFDALAIALWRRERERALEHVPRVRRGPLRPRLDDIDRYRLRYLLAAALVAAAFTAGGDAPARLAQAFLPDPGPLLGDKPMVIEAWASPAEYTHAPPVSLSDQVGRRVATPPTVETTVRVTGPAGAPRLVFAGSERRQARFVRAADGAWEARLAIPGAGKLSIVRFHERAFWRLAPAPDAAPRAEFTAPIALLRDEHAAVSWRARDDYGVRRLMLRVRPVAPPPGLVRADPIDTELEAPAGDPREAEAETELDLAAHAYAGMEVEARIVAVDALGQEGASAPLRFTMPERAFLQPLARAAIEIRRHVLAERRPYRAGASERRQNTPAGDLLLGNQRLELRDYARRPALLRAPEGIRRAARLLSALTSDAQDGYFRDRAVYLGLALARSELATARSTEEASAAAETLWHVAMRAEYGVSADALRAMQEAYQALAQALAEKAPPERIRQLVDALRRASERYMQALVQEALRNGAVNREDDTEEQLSLSSRDIDDLLDEIQRLGEQGRTAEAAAMMAMHAMLMQNLEARIDSTPGPGEGEQSGEQRLQQSMDELSEAMGEQRALNDETQRAQQEQQQRGSAGGGGEQQGGEGGDELADRQSRIRQGLAEAQRMSEESGAAPSENLNAAGQAMRQAENALRRGDIEGARNAQAAAMENLREGAEALAAQMREEGAPDRGAQGQAGERGDGEEDPLGRGTGSGRGGEQTGGGDPARTRAVFDQILRRAQDPNRPEAEREYLRRLLDRFGGS